MGYTSTRLEVNVVCGAVPPTPATREPYPDLACGNGPRPIRGRFVHRGALLGDAVYPSLATGQSARYLSRRCTGSGSGSWCRLACRDW